VIPLAAGSHAQLCSRVRSADFTGRVADSGEGRWTIDAAIDESVPAPVLTAALFDGFVRGASRVADKLLPHCAFNSAPRGEPDAKEELSMRNSHRMHWCSTAPPVISPEADLSALQALTSSSLLDSPIVGVARSEWTTPAPPAARQSLEQPGVDGLPLASRMRYVSRR